MLKKYLVFALALATELTFFSQLLLAQTNFNRIVELKGSAKLKRNGSNVYQSAFLGMKLVLGDTLLPDPGTTVKVSCGDGTLRPVQTGVESGLKTICPEAKSTDPRTGEAIFLDLLRGEYTYWTLLLTDKPPLTWPSVAGATHYHVKVKAGDKIIWETTVAGTNTDYQGPALRAKFNYVIC
jgi:hypothetical protein